MLRPKTEFDRQMARLAAAKVWEHVGKSILDDLNAAERAEHYAAHLYRLAEDGVDADGNPFRLGIKTQLLRAGLEFAHFAHTVRKDTILDRTIPAIQRVQMESALSALPKAEDEAVTNPTDTVEAARRESVALLRGIIARLESAAPNGSAPGLVLLRKDADG